MPPLPPYDQAFLRRQAALTRKILQHYEDGINFLTPTLNTVKWNGRLFKLSEYPALKKRIDTMASKLQNQVYSTIVNGVKDSWDFSNKKNDVLVDKRLSGSRLKKKARQAMYDPNDAALKQFIDRKERGLGLSQRVWNTVDPFKKELEQGLGISIGKGESAAEMATELKKQLLDPERLFRRVRGEDGKLYLSTAARNYHPGQGVYRSSFKNALRLTRTENNMAYRTADHERWKALPFVTGIVVKLSSAHPKVDICDDLDGKYPKDFKFAGWHPQCLCFAVPEMMSDEDYDKLEDQILAGEPISVPPGKLVTAPHDGFTKYLAENKEMLAKLKSEPYWMRDNKQYLSVNKGERIIEDHPKPGKLNKGETAPAGKKIGPQFSNMEKDIEENVMNALAAIDEVHGDGILPDIPFIVDTKNVGTGIQASYYVPGGKSVHISIVQGVKNPEAAIAHEFGHFLDNEAIGETGKFESNRSKSKLKGVLKAAEDSNAIKSNRRLLEDGMFEKDGEFHPISFEYNSHINYILSNHEIWARAYAQYMAKKSGNKAMLAGINERIKLSADIPHKYQWDWDDFKEIEKEIEKVLVKLGWISQG